jgi:hypothetical protein
MQQLRHLFRTLSGPIRRRVDATEAPRAIGAF